MAEDLAKGVIDRFRSLPMARSALPAGRTLADLAGTTRTMVLLLAVGLAIGFRWQTSPMGLLAGVAIALGFGYAWSWAMAALGLVVRTPEAVQAAAFMGRSRWRSPARCLSPPRPCRDGSRRLPPTSPSP